MLKIEKLTFPFIMLILMILLYFIFTMFVNNSDNKNVINNEHKEIQEKEEKKWTWVTTNDDWKFLEKLDIDFNSLNDNDE